MCKHAKRVPTGLAGIDEAQEKNFQTPNDTTTSTNELLYNNFAAAQSGSRD
jgi:hypothetical protein